MDFETPRGKKKGRGKEYKFDPMDFETIDNTDN